MKDYKKKNFILRTAFWECLVLTPLKSAPQKLNFVMAKTKSKSYTANDLARSRIVTHSNAASFSIKTILCETNILFSKNY